MKRRGTIDVISKTEVAPASHRRPSAPQLSDELAHHQPESEYVQQKSKQAQNQSSRRASVSGLPRETVPQRTHGELTSQDSILSRLFSGRDSKSPIPDYPASGTGTLQRQSRSAANQSPSYAQRTPATRPSDLGLIRQKTSEDLDSATNPKSPLTEQVTSQKDKLTHMLNLLRVDSNSAADPPDPKTDQVAPKSSSASPHVSEELLHHKSVQPLESQGITSSGRSHPDAKLHPHSTRELHRQKPSDGLDAHMVSLPMVLSPPIE